MKPGGKTTLPKLEKLVTAIKDILSQAILDGGSSLRTMLLRMENWVIFQQSLMFMVVMASL